MDILTVDFNFWLCVTDHLGSANSVTSMLVRTIIPLALFVLKSIHGNGFRYLYITLAASFYRITFLLKHFYPYVHAVLCRFILVPLAMFTFLAYKYCKTRITIDAVEKFLQMQQMLVPLGLPTRTSMRSLAI